MLDIVPFTGTWWVMTHLDKKSCGVGKLVQTLLPELVFIAITTAAISKQEDVAGLWVFLFTNRLPPSLE